jgi:hypothetical protein
MNIRSFGWRDVALLHRYLNRGLFLDSTRVLIHGTSLIPMGAFLSFLGPSTRMFTYRCEDDSRSGNPLIGQVTLELGTSYARLSFLAPEDTMDQSELSALSDYMAKHMGEKGAFHILADIDENSQVFQMLHSAGFAIYARQCIWRLDGEPSGEAEAANWRAWRSRDAIGVRSLYCNVVPGLVQQVEPLPKKNIKGMVCYKNGDLQAFVELKYGRNGVWAQPFIHPDAQDFDRHLVYLLRELPGRGKRPIYICVRSYQSWLDSAFEKMRAVSGPTQAVMVRHMAVTRRVNQALPIPNINGTRAEPTAPIAHCDESQFQVLAQIDRQTGADALN